MKKILVLVILTLSYVFPQENFNDCPPQGDSKIKSVKALNVLKNRTEIPQVSDIDITITLSKILKPGNDKNRFTTSTAAEITGYILEVSPGGSESCNCHAKGDKLIDTHIEVGTSSHSTKKMIVEVSPRFKALHSGLWSTKNLRKLIGKKVKIKGWLFFDAEHKQNATNTNPNGNNNWRTTCWELHPVTSIDVVN